MAEQMDEDSDCELPPLTSANTSERSSFSDDEPPHLEPGGFDASTSSCSGVSVLP